MKNKLILSLMFVVIVLIVFLFGCAIKVPAQEIRRPTVDDHTVASNSGSVCFQNAGTLDPGPAGAMPNFYDSGGEATSSVDDCENVSIDCGNLADTSIVKEGNRFTTWAAASGGYSALNLIIYSSCSKIGSSGGLSCAVEYSTNSGSTWTTIYNVSNGTRVLTRDTIALSPSQTLSTLQVRMCVNGWDDGSGGVGGTKMTGYDIRTEGTLGGGARHKVVVVGGN